MKITIEHDDGTTETFAGPRALDMLRERLSATPAYVLPVVTPAPAQPPWPYDRPWWESPITTCQCTSSFVPS